MEKTQHNNKSIDGIFSPKKILTRNKNDLPFKNSYKKDYNRNNYNNNIDEISQNNIEQQITETDTIELFDKNIQNIINTVNTNTVNTNTVNTNTNDKWKRSQSHTQQNSEERAWNRAQEQQPGDKTIFMRNRNSTRNFGTNNFGTNNSAHNSYNTKKTATSSEPSEESEPILVDIHKPHFDLEKYFDKADIEKSISKNRELKLTDIALYSISRPREAAWIYNYIESFFLNSGKINPPLNINVMHNFRIIDGFACIGGNTITFAKNFGKVVSIELNPLHFNLLKENLETLDITNVEVHNDDFFHYINTVSDDTTNKDSDIVFLDLPWNCKHYRRIDYFNLKANNMELPEIVNMLHGKGYKYVVVKGPLNLNVGPLYKNSLYNNLIIHKNEESYICMVILY